MASREASKTSRSWVRGTCVDGAGLPVWRPGEVTAVISNPDATKRSKHTSPSDSSARRRTWSEQRPGSIQFVVDDRVSHSGIDPFVDSRIHGAEYSGGFVNSLERDM